MIKRALFVVTCTVAALVPGIAASQAVADGIPSGQRVLGQSVVEPVYDAEHAGAISFISTPAHAPLEADPVAWAPLYLPVYPAGSPVGALICPHVPVDTCPDHGPIIAGLAQGAAPDVYGGGVLGHDHVATLRGVGFHVALEPIVVLFTSNAAAREHLLTSASIEAAVTRGDAITVPLAAAALHGAQVSSKVWQLATPVG